MSAPKLSSDLLRRIFVSASIRRWNDQACPVDFVELDKQAHKMVIAYFIGKYEEENRVIDWEKLIKYFCFEFFSRVVLTDIKPPIFHKLQAHYRTELADYVMGEIGSELCSYNLLDEMEGYLKNPPSCIEVEILRASHFYASKWEFDIIYNFNPNMYDVKNIKQIIDSEVEQFYHLKGVQNIVLYNNISEVINMFGQLRFQKRWSQTPRIPETSVLGHTLVVAISAYLLSFDIGACEQMRINHFICGLFHDLPEILTRDIISPIKRSVRGLDEKIKTIEQEEVNRKILSRVSESIAEDIRYFTQDEFANRYKREHFVFRVNDGQELIENYNKNEFSPVYGSFLKFCDNLSAFLEARISISHGISSKDLVEGADGIYQKCKDLEFNGIKMGLILEDFL